MILAIFIFFTTNLCVFAPKPVCLRGTIFPVSEIDALFEVLCLYCAEFLSHFENGNVLELFQYFALDIARLEKYVAREFAKLRARTKPRNRPI